MAKCNIASIFLNSLNKDHLLGTATFDATFDATARVRPVVTVTIAKE